MTSLALFDAKWLSQQKKNMCFSHLPTSQTILTQSVGHDCDLAGGHTMPASHLLPNNDTTTAAHTNDAGTSNILHASYVYLFQHTFFSGYRHFPRVISYPHTVKK